MSADRKRPKTITIELTDELRDRVNWVATFEERSAAQIVRDLLERYTEPFMTRIEAHRRLLKAPEGNKQPQPEGLNSKENGDEQPTRPRG